MVGHRARWSVDTLLAASGGGTSGGWHLLLGAAIFLVMTVIWIWGLPRFHISQRATPRLDRATQVSGAIVFGVFSLICLVSGLVHLL